MWKYIRKSLQQHLPATASHPLSHKSSPQRMWFYYYKKCPFSYVCSNINISSNLVNSFVLLNDSLSFLASPKICLSTSLYARAIRLTVVHDSQTFLPSAATVLQQVAAVIWNTVLARLKLSKLSCKEQEWTFLCFTWWLESFKDVTWIWEHD